MKLDCDKIARLKAEGKTKEAKELVKQYNEKFKIKREKELAKIKKDLRECTIAINNALHPAYNKKWKAKNPEKIKLYSMRDKYGKQQGNIVYLLEKMF